MSQSIATQSGPSKKTFSDLGLDEKVVRALEADGLEHPTACQAAHIPLLRQGKNLFIEAPTGEGKTLTFLSYCLDRLLQFPADCFNAEMPLILIVAPTRNLSEQIYRVTASVNKHLGFAIAALTGRQDGFDGLNVHLLIATPGALLSMTPDLTPILEDVKIAVFDEADRLYAPDFYDQTALIERALPRKAQKLYASATLTDALKRHLPVELPKKDGGEPRKSPRQARIRQRAVFIKEEAKIPWLADHLAKIAKEDGAEKILVFTNFRAMVEQIHKALRRGFRGRLHRLHGGMDDAARARQVRNFEKPGRQIMICTDLAGRGLDFAGKIDLVLNFDPPFEPNAYLHRIGRSGRAGARGDSLTLFTVGQRKLFAQIEKYLGQKIPVINP